MSSSHALSDDQVASELKKMTAFIRQEALEKAREIQLKADEEFAIEKSKLVRQETDAIDSQYEKKFKQASMSQQITKSTSANRTRLRILGARQSLLNDLFEEARSKLAKAAHERDYDSILKDLILEGMFLLNEPKVAVRSKAGEKKQVEKAAKEASKEYKEKMGKECEAVFDDKNPLPDESAGGVFIVGGNGKIEINNTLEERLKMCETDALPMVRETLFGKNVNRKFHD